VSLCKRQYSTNICFRCCPSDWCSVQNVCFLLNLEVTCKPKSHMHATKINCRIVCYVRIKSYAYRRFACYNWIYMSNSLDLLQSAPILICAIFTLLQHIFNSLYCLRLIYYHFCICIYITSVQERELNFTFLFSEHTFHTNKSTVQYHVKLQCIIFALWIFNTEVSNIFCTDIICCDHDILWIFTNINTYKNVRNWYLLVAFEVVT
jgi:hypothetical protein